jgi:hypothetical protein
LALALLGAGIAFGGGFTVAAGLLAARRLTVILPAPDSLSSTSVGWINGKTEVILVYIGSPRCAASASPRIPQLVRIARESLATEARRSGSAFASVGVAATLAVPAGLSHLSGIGPFDEIVAGRDWGNHASLRYVYGSNGGSGVTPQLLVVIRRGTGELTPRVGEERVVLRVAGLANIEQWIADGARVSREPQ